MRPKRSDSQSERRGLSVRRLLTAFLLKFFMIKFAVVNQIYPIYTGSLYTAI